MFKYEPYAIVAQVIYPHEPMPKYMLYSPDNELLVDECGSKEFENGFSEFYDHSLEDLEGMYELFSNYSHKCGVTVLSLGHENNCVLQKMVPLDEFDFPTTAHYDIKFIMNCCLYPDEKELTYSAYTLSPHQYIVEPCNIGDYAKGIYDYFGEFFGRDRVPADSFWSELSSSLPPFGEIEENVHYQLEIHAGSKIKVMPLRKVPVEWFDVPDFRRVYGRQAPERPAQHLSE